MARLILILLFTSTFAFSQTYEMPMFIMSQSGASLYHRTITVNHTKCGSSNSTNFTVEVSISDASFKSISNGGHVSNINGYDILFYSNSGFSSILNWDLEKYDPVNGIVIAHVLIPVITYSTNATFYMEYGGTATTFQGGATGSAWNSNYVMVQHLPNGTTLTTNDATSNGNNGVNTGATATTGQIDGAASFSSAYINCGLGSSLNLTGNLTVSAWVYPTSVTAATFGQEIVTECDVSANEGPFGLGINRNGFGGGGSVYMSWNSNLVVYSSTLLTINTWNHIVVTKTSTGGGNFKAQIYINGVADNNGTSADGSSQLYTVIGRILYAPSPLYFIGSLDEVRLLNTAISQDWITTEYNNQRNPGNIGIGNFLTYSSEY